MGYNIAITYDFQGGSINGSSTLKIRVKEDSSVPQPGGENSGITAPTRTNYSIQKYCIAQTDSEGNVLYDESGNIKLGDDVNFATYKATSDVTICAVWWEDFTMNLHYGTNFSNVKTVRVSRTEAGLPNQITEASVKQTNYTFLGYYLDKEKTTSVTFPTTLDFSEENSVIDVWGDSLDGIYQVIRSEEDMQSFSFIDGTKLYLLADIDMQKIYDNGKSFSFPSTFSGEFIGNGHTISNLKLTQSASSTSDKYFGIFKALNSGAIVKDVTFKNVTYTAQLSNRLASEYCAGIFAGIIRDNATVQNVSVEGGTFTYTIVSGYDEDKVTINDGIGSQLSDAKVTSFECKDITVVGSKLVLTSITNEKGYAVYVTFTRTPDGHITLGDVYGLATATETTGADGSKTYSYTSINSKSLEKNSDGSWTFQGSTQTYQISVDLNDGTFSVEVK
jgi:hypothetical protein